MYSGFAQRILNLCYGGIHHANQQKRTHKRKEQIEKAIQCKSAEELMALAKTGGYELTKEEAETYLAELADYELDSSEMKNIAGGKCYMRTHLDDIM